MFNAFELEKEVELSTCKYGWKSRQLELEESLSNSHYENDSHYLANLSSSQPYFFVKPLNTLMLFGASALAPVAVANGFSNHVSLLLLTML